MKKLIILVGNIGSGKSTLARKLSKKYIVICRDFLRCNIGAGRYIFNPKYEPAIAKSNIYIFSQFIKLGVDIVLDETNVTKELRRNYIKIAKKEGYFIEIRVLPILSKSESVGRRMLSPHDNNSKKYWGRVWEMFDLGYEEPSLKEGVDKITLMRRK